MRKKIYKHVYNQNDYKCIEGKKLENHNLYLCIYFVIYLNERVIFFIYN